MKKMNYPGFMPRPERVALQVYDSKKITILTIKTDGHPLLHWVPTTEKDESNTTLGTHLGA